MLTEGLIFALVLGKLRGGKFKSLGRVRINNWWLFLMAFVIEFGAVFAVSAGIEIVGRYRMYLHILSYLVLFAGVMSNREYPSMWIIFLGSLLNFVVIAINGGAMPISLEGLHRTGLDNYVQIINAGGLATHQALTASTKLAFLADIIVLPKPYPFAKVMSIGDVLICLGVIIFVQRAMLLEKRMGRTNMIHFKYKSRI